MHVSLLHSENMLRRLIIFLVSVFALLLVIVATLPLWLGTLTAEFAPRFGITYGEYTRNGYNRFALSDVVYRGEGIHATVDRVEIASPMAWIWQRYAGEGADAKVGRWAVTLEPTDAAERPVADPGAPAGWLPLRTKIRELVAQIEPWLARATVGPGTVESPAGTINVAALIWQDRELRLNSLSFDERVIDAQLSVPSATDEIRFSARTKTDEARFNVTSRGAAVAGELAWWGETASFNAQFPMAGWMPERAEVSADNWDLPAERLQLGEYYAAVRGKAHLAWSRDRFTIDLSAQSMPLEQPNPPPALDVEISGGGDLQALTIERFHAAMTGATAQLTTPITVTRAGEIRDVPARLATEFDLAKLPWIKATGVASAEVEVVARPPGATTPPVVFSLKARDVSTEGIALRSIVANGRLEWPRAELKDATLIGAHGEQLRASGGWDFKAKEAHDVKIAGELRHETFARWLPKDVRFAGVQIDASAGGPLAQLQHRGNVRVSELAAGSVKPLDVGLAWNGSGQRAEQITARVTAGESRLSLTAEADMDSVQLTDLEFTPRGEPPVRLVRPATIRWKPALQIEGLTLHSEKSGISADLVWGESGRIALALRQIPSTWLTDFVAVPGPPWTLLSVAINGSWEGGPLTMEAVAEVTTVLRENRNLAASVHLRGDPAGVRLISLRAMENGAAVVSASGRAPAVITPRGSPAFHINPEGAIELDATLVENRAFWEELERLAGINISAPQLTARIAGTWREPRGELSARVDRVALQPKGEKRLPVVEQLEIVARADRGGIVLDRLALRVENQRVQASGRLPLPEEDWNELREDPLAYARRGAELRVEAPQMEIAAFKEFLPEAIVPQGTFEANVTLQAGALGGSLRLRDAATRPIGALGALQEFTADVHFEREVIRLASVSAQLAGEPLGISGTITLPTLAEARRADNPAALPKFDLVLKAENIPLVRRSGTLVRADLDLALTSPPDASPLVSGSVRLRDSLFLQDVRDMLPSGTKSKSGRPPYFAVEADPFSEWRLDVRVVGEEFMRLRTTLFNGTASADFRLAGTLAEPTLLGEATIDRGNIRLPFANFKVEEARVTLTPAQPHEPQIFLTARTRKYEYDLTMEVSGAAASPTVTFESTPPLEHGQVLLMVTAGIVPNEGVTFTQQQRATRLGTYLGQSLLSSFGDGGDENRLTITSGEDISEQGRETYGIEYEFDDRWSLTAEYDEYDSHTLGVKWKALARGGPPLASSGSEPFEGEDGAGGMTGRKSRETSRNAEQPSETVRDKPAKLDVSGLGWLADFEMEASLKRLLGDAYDSELESNSIEDALFLLLAGVREDGYLRPSVQVHATNRDGTRREFTVDADLSTQVPRDLTARALQFLVERGTHYFVDDLVINGLQSIDQDTARAYFVSNPGLLRRQKALTFTPDRLKRGASSLEAALNERGYADAKVTATASQIDHNTGAVEVAVEVVEGPRWGIAGVRVENAIEGLGAAEELTGYVGEPWSESVEQDIAAEIRRNHLEHGYADARVRVHRSRKDENGVTSINIIADVTPGPRVTVGEIRFEGNIRTNDAVLQRRVAFSPGDPLNPLAVQQARHRIARLGVFDDADVYFEPLEGPVRDVVFEVEPGRRMELNLLAGYNTYEQLRAGVEIRRYNLWGRAHQTRGLLVQSMKSTRGEYAYTVPELFGEDVRGTARLFGLQREEVAFLRQEYGARFTIDTPLRFLGANLTAGYTFEVLRNRDNELETRTSDRRQVEVASVEAGLTRDRRDNPLLPRDGYRWYGRVEAASEMLGGRAEYQRIEFGGTYHRPLGEGRWLHFGAAHGVVTTLGRDDDELPVNKRFFPGGDGSIRGYQQGEAAPRGADGRFLGAKSYLGGNVEFEQAIVEKWSAVLFVDALGSAQRLTQYPFEKVLVAAGIGARYQTLIGPIRAEYGHNLNPRDHDPRGTFLLSIGFPF